MTLTQLSDLIPASPEPVVVDYGTIVADPPWFERGGGKYVRGANRHYPLLKTPDIIRVMLTAPCWRPARDAHLYLWVTNSFLPDGLLVMRALGFRYVTNLVWVKEGQYGLGHYFRGQHELVLFGVRGRTPRQVRDQTSVIGAAKRDHSAKPAEFYDAVMRVSPKPYLEMFARKPREGWDVWGDEIAN